MSETKMEINTSRLNEELNKIKTEREHLNSVLKQLNRQMELLEGHWKSGTKEEMYNKYKDFSNHYETLISSFDNDIKYLEEVIESYESFDKMASKEVEDKMNE